MKRFNEEYGFTPCVESKEHTSPTKVVQPKKRGVYTRVIDLSDTSIPDAKYSIGQLLINTDWYSGIKTYCEVVSIEPFNEVRRTYTYRVKNYSR